MRNKRDTTKIVLQKMIGYCDNIDELMQKYNSSFELYVSDISFQYSCNMCVLQIGELTTRLSDDFKAQHPEIPWRLIKAMRNIHAHEYESVDFEGMWDTLTQDIPVLRKKLEKLLIDRKLNDNNYLIGEQ